MRISRLPTIRSNPVDADIWSVAGVLAYVVGFACLIAFGNDVQLIRAFAYHAPAAGAAAFIAHRFLRAQGRERFGFFVLLAAIAAWKVGETAGTFAVSSDTSAIQAAAAALPALMGYALFCVAIVTLAPGSGLRDPRLLLEAATVMCVAGLLGWQLLFEDVAHGPTSVHRLIAAAYPVLDLGMLTALLIAFYGTRGSPDRSASALVAACLALVVGDALAAIDLLARPTATSSFAGGIGWVAAYLFLAIAIRHRPGPDAKLAHRPRRVFGAIQVGLPYAALTPLVLVTSYHVLHGRNVRELTLGTFIAAALLVARQYLLFADNRRLHANRERLLESLNTKAAELEREIGERRRAEGALRQSEERFRAVAENLDEGLLMTDLNDTVLYANPKLSQLTGYRREQLIGNRAAELFLPPERHGVAQELKAQHVQGISNRYEIEQARADGTRFLTEVFGAPLRDNAGDIVGTIDIVNDITERRQNEIGARRREKQLRDQNAALERLSRSTAFESHGLLAALREISEVAGTTLETGRVGIWLFDATSLRASCVDEFDRATGTHAAGLSMATRDYVTYFAAVTSDRTLAVPDVMSDHRTAGFATDHLLPAGVTAILNAPVRVLGRTAGFVCHEHIGEPRKWSKEEESFAASMAGFVATMLEAQEREEARSAGARLAGVLGASPDIVAAWDAGGTAVYLNEAARKALGLRPDSDISSVQLGDFHDAASGDLLRARALPRALANGQWSGETVVRRADGTDMPVSQVILAHRENGTVRYLATMMRDLSERKRAEEERQRLDRKLQETQMLESLGILAGGIAHDFNNMLSAILGNTQIAQMLVPADATDAREALADVETTAKRAGELVRQLLAFSGKGRTATAVISASDLVEETARLLLAVLSRSATVQVDVAPNLPSVEADGPQLRQIVMNLLTNAADAMPPQGGEIRVRTGLVRLSRQQLDECHFGQGRPEGPYVAIQVSDTGTGMDRATINRIFDPFFTTKEHGHGLGLAAVLGIVRSHNGAMKVSSTPGSGSSFTVLLPPATKPAAAHPERVPETGLRASA